VGERRARFVAIVVVAWLCLAGASKAAPAKAPVRLSILTNSQRVILGKDSFRVRVSASRTGTVRVFGTVRARAKGSTSVVATRVKSVKVRRGRGRVVSLRLSRAGARELRGCQKRKLTVQGALAGRRGRAPGRPARYARNVRADSAACRARGGRASGGSGGSGGGGEQTPVDFETSNADRCDFIDGAHCLFPFPNDHFTTPDPSTATGRRLDLSLLSMPTNRGGKPIDPSVINRNDGFSPGAKIVTRVPGLDSAAAFRRTGAVPITDMGRSFDADQPVVLIDARTRARHLIWAEVDANPEDRADVNLIIHPGANLEEGGRYIVALRRLRDESGGLLAPSEGFRLYRDRRLTTNPAVEERRAHFEGIFRTLAEAGIDRDDLYRAWDFTVASERNLSERMLHIRDDAFARLGDTDLADLTVQGSSPPFEVTRVEDFTAEQNARIARRVEGRIATPCYLDQPGCPPGSQFAYAPGSSVPSAIPGNVHLSKFICNIPRVAVDGPDVRPARPSLYGHGLLGEASSVSSGSKTALANEHNFVMCATDWIGMACPAPDTPDADEPDRLPGFLTGIVTNPPNSNDCDIGNVATILADASRFPTLVDRVQQGMLNFLYLGRAMIHPDGFVSDPAFQFERGGAPKPVIDTTRLFYDGGSQGGIIGGSLTAVAPDFDRAHLGVPGMNYSILLRRSIDFDTYAQVMYEAYPDELERPLILSLIQTLWDRGEANGYAHHMTDDPYPNTPPHEVILDMAFGDHQVANIATEVEARTIGARIRTPALDPGRSIDAVPYYGIDPIPAFPFRGSALIVADVGPLREEGGRTKGTNPPPPENTPNREGVDPHGPDQSETVYGRQVISDFLRIGGTVSNGCGPRPCYIDGYTGPP
jgi:hypothetical protein